jgi:tRNA nucleotidyltransferase/poly(A) polymerase
VKEPASPLFLEVLKRHRQWPAALQICQILTAKGFQAVFAGGAVRDALRGISPHDFDIATNATPAEVETLFREWNPVSVGKSFGVIVLPQVLPGESGSIEIATFRKDGKYSDGRHPDTVIFSDLQEDAKRRDFTVNALFFDPVSAEILDFVGGLSDLKSRALRAVGQPKARFDEDELRMLRAIRFSGQLQFEIAEETFSAIRDKAVEISRRSADQRAAWVSRERIRDEVDKMLSASDAALAFRNLSSSGIGELVFEAWTHLVLPVRDHVFKSSKLEARRLALFYRALQKYSVEEVQERLMAWKYGRPFIDTSIWVMRSGRELRVQDSDPVEKLVPRESVVKEFRDRYEADRLAKEIKRDECRFFSANERDWMSALEHWTDPRASVALDMLDQIHGQDGRRELAIKSRGLKVGQEDPSRARAADLEGLGLQGPNLGREIRRLSREILLKTARTLRF